MENLQIWLGFLAVIVPILMAFYTINKDRTKNIEQQKCYLDEQFELLKVAINTQNIDVAVLKNELTSLHKRVDNLEKIIDVVVKS